MRLSVHIVEVLLTSIWHFNDLSMSLSVSWLIIIGHWLLVNNRLHLLMLVRSWNLDIASFLPSCSVMTIFSMLRNLNDACMLC